MIKIYFDWNVLSQIKNGKHSELKQDKPTNWFIIPKEVEMLVKRLLIYFGTDLNNEGELKPDEYNNEKWDGRKWKFDNLTLRLQSINGYVQLYWDYEKEEKASR